MNGELFLVLQRLFEKERHCTNKKCVIPTPYQIRGKLQRVSSWGFEAHRHPGFPLSRLRAEALWLTSTGMTEKIRCSISLNSQFSISNSKF